MLKKDLSKSKKYSNYEFKDFLEFAQKKQNIKIDTLKNFVKLLSYTY